MKAKLIFFRISLIVALCLPTLARAGDREGNGGYGHVCESSVIFLDLFEAERLDQKTFHRSTELSLEGELERALARMPVTEEIRDELRTRIQEVRSKAIFIVAPTVLPPSRDANFRVNSDSGCTFRNVANFNRVLMIDSVLYNRMAPVDQAALFLHELIYEMHRHWEWMVKNSDQIRPRIAELLANESFDQKNWREWISDGSELLKLCGQEGNLARRKADCLKTLGSSEASFKSKNGTSWTLVSQMPLRKKDRFALTQNGGRVQTWLNNKTKRVWVETYPFSRNYISAELDCGRLVGIEQPRASAKFG